jgi:hypothetical protein
MDQIKEEPIDDPTLYGEISVKNANYPVWLVKVPEFLAAYWRKLSNDTELGKLYIETSDKPQQTIKVLNLDSNNSKKQNLNFSEFF